MYGRRKADRRVLKGQCIVNHKGQCGVFKILIHNVININLVDTKLIKSKKTALIVPTNLRHGLNWQSVKGEQQSC